MTTIASALLWNSVAAAILSGILILLSRTFLLARRPALRHALWLLVLAKLVTPPLVPVPVLQSRLLPDDVLVGNTATDTRALKAPPVTNLATNTAQTKAPILSSVQSYAITSIPSIATGVLLISITGTVVLVSFMLRRARRFGRLLNHAVPATDGLQAEAARIASLMGLSRAPRIRLIDANVTPFLWVSVHGPVVILPTGLSLQLNQEQLSAILAHEIAHYVRRDHWTNCGVFAVTVLFWWHPAVWYARRRTCEAQDECCDALLLTHGAAQRRRYAETLLAVLDYCSQRKLTRPSVAPAFGNGRFLRRRFEMLQHRRIVHRLSWPATAFILALAVFLPCIPGRSGSASDAPVVKESQANNITDQEPAILSTPTGSHFNTQIHDPRRLPDENESTSLGLIGPKISDEQLLPLMKFTKVQELGLRETTVTGKGLRHLSNMKRLRSLELIGPQVTDEWLKNLPELPRLEYLFLDGSRISDSGLQFLKKFPQLENLSLRKTAIGDSGLEVLRHLPKLRSLSLTDTKVSDQGLAALAYVPRLTYLSLGSPNVKGSGTEHIQKLKELSDLQFAGKYVTDDWMKGVEPIRTVSWLELWGTNVTADGLSAIRKWTKLKHLYLNNNPKLADGVAIQFNDLYNLDNIEMTRTQVTSKEVAQIKRALPDTHVTNGFPEIPAK